MKPDFILCVTSLTYNHSLYITDALNGFTMQKTNFPFVVLLIDDASTDGTQEIIRTYIKNNFDVADPDLAYERDTEYANITYAQHKDNRNCYIVVHYLKYNHYQVRKNKIPYLAQWREKVKYEALCEGDDYWIDPLKLQKQVDFMDANPEYGLVWGKAKCFIQEQQKFKGTVGDVASSFDELINNNVVCTLTSLYRTEVAFSYNQFPKDQSWLMGDYPLWLYIASKSKIHFMDEQFAVYRILSDSASHSRMYSKRIAFLESVYDIKYFFLKYTGRQIPSTLIENKTCQAYNIAFNSAEYNCALNLFKEIPCNRRDIRIYLKYIISVIMVMRNKLKS